MSSSNGIAALVAALVAWPAVAAAERPPDQAFTPRLSAVAGIGLWLGDIGRIAPTGAVLHLGGALRINPAVFATVGLDVGRGGDHDAALARPIDASIQHGSVGLRHPLISFGDDPAGLGGDLSVSAAIGHERIAWAGGGGLRRTVVSLGIGGGMTVPRADRTRWSRSVRYDLRFLIARAPEVDKAPGARPYDRTLLLELSCHVGR